jgi:hypothetical protein
MKRKDLYNYVREQIVNELTIVTKNTSSDEIPNIAKAEKTDPNSVKKAVDAAKASGKDVNIAELARKGRNIQMGENFAAIKDAYAGSMIERILDTVEGAGEEGITPKNIMAAVGIKFSSVLNPIIGELIELGAVTGPAPKEAEVEPEEITPEDDLASLNIPKVVANPDEEEDEVEKDEWETSDEEESSDEEEPKINAKDADKEAEKELGKLNAKKLSPEEEDIINKYKNAITNKSKVLKDKKASTDDKAKAKAALDSYKKKDDLKKLFNKKGGKSLIDFINDELNK